MRFNRIKMEKDIEKAVEEYGFLPFFRSVIPGLSLEEMADPSVWFPEKGEGVWEWKDPVIASTGCAYGKFFLAHPGFVSKDLFMILAAYRRDGYDIEGMINDGLLSHNEVNLYNILAETGSERGAYLRAKANMSKSSFDKYNTRLQMKTFMMISGFEFGIAKDGHRYGWGVARYAIPEAVYENFEESIDKWKPKEAYSILFRHLKSLLPAADDSDITRFLG